MHRLRRPLEEPACLSGFDYRSNNWDDVSSRQKDIIWEKIFSMQGQRCAYCEKSIPTKGESRHIEHFRRKGIPAFKHLTFIWDNLFGSCTDGKRCGRFKDKQDYADGDIIKMDEEDPECFFTFLSYGSISINSGLNVREKFRANETLRVFALDPSHGGVRNERKQMIESFRHLANGITVLVNEFSNAEYIDLLNDEIESRLEELSGIPFETAVRHFVVGRNP